MAVRITSVTGIPRIQFLGSAVDELSWMAVRSGRTAEPRVNLTGAIDSIHRILSSSVCASVFRELRSKERARKWTLEAMMTFWVAVVIRAPASLRSALDELFGSKGATELQFETSRSSFFERAQNMSWLFFRELFERFVAEIAAESPANFESDLRAQLPHFPQVWIVDGSSLFRVAHRLKVTRGVAQILIPGSLLVCYDLFRGIPRVVEFHEKLLGGEASRLRALLDRVPAGTLLVADRGYSSVRLFLEVAQRGLACLVRLKVNHAMSLVAELGRHVDDGCEVIDRIVTIGQGGTRSPRLRVRVIEKLLTGGGVLRLATTELDPEKLPALVALRLYRRRWAIERLFYDLKEVLNLRRFYAANTNAVAMQVYASAIVYVALRVAQGRIAAEHGLRPEELSTVKLFPRVATAHFDLVTKHSNFEDVQEANPRVKLTMPDWTQCHARSVPLSQLLVTPRKGPRRRPGYSKARTRVVPLRRYEPERTARTRPRRPS